MPSDYVGIKTFIKCDPLLVQLLYVLSNDGEMLYTMLPWGYFWFVQTI